MFLIECFLLFTLIFGIVGPHIPYPKIQYNQDLKSEVALNPEIGSDSYYNFQHSENLLQFKSVDSGEILMSVSLFISFCLLIKIVIEVLTIYQQYQNGRREHDGQIVLIYTTAMHSPYSIGKYIFIPQNNEWSIEELQIIIDHEKAHHLRKHLMDNILASLNTVVFWFNPLAWLIQKELKLLHEFEADAIASKGHIRNYGTLLLSGNIFKTTPSIVQSFFNNPIKSRIQMLCNLKTPKMYLKLLAVIPVLISSGIILAQNAQDLSIVKEGNVMKFNGNVFIWNESSTLQITAIMSEFHSDKQTRRVKTFPVTPQIISVNGKKPQIFTKYDIYNNENGRVNKFGPEIENFSNYLKSNIKIEKNIADRLATIDLSNIVLDEDQRVIYYESKILCFDMFKKTTEVFTSDELVTINERLNKVILGHKINFTYHEFEQPVYFHSFGHIRFNPVTFKARIPEKK